MKEKEKKKLLPSSQFFFFFIGNMKTIIKQKKTLHYDGELVPKNKDSLSSKP